MDVYWTNISESEMEMGIKVNVQDKLSVLSTSAEWPHKINSIYSKKLCIIFSPLFTAFCQNVVIYSPLEN